MTDNEYYVTELPNFLNDTWPCQYAGVFPTGNDGANNVFFWMYPVFEDPENDAPVAVFLNGGPGASSAFANFLESGPQRILATETTSESGDTTFEYSIYNSKDTWTKTATMIYVDQPTGTGFSYGAPYVTSMEEASEQFVTFMVSLYEAFPALQERELHMTGASYAGKYIPKFTVDLLKKNDQLPSTYFNIKSIQMGDPYTAPYSQRLLSSKLPSSLNLYDLSNLPQVAALDRSCAEDIGNLSTNAATCEMLMIYFSVTTGGVYTYDVRKFGYDWDYVEPAVTTYFIDNQAEIQPALHLQGDTMDPYFTFDRSEVADAFTEDGMLAYIADCQSLVDQGVPMLVYAGEFDDRCGPNQQVPWLKRLNFTDSESFWAQAR